MSDKLVGRPTSWLILHLMEHRTEALNELQQDLYNPDKLKKKMGDVLSNYINRNFSHKHREKIKSSM